MKKKMTKKKSNKKIRRKTSFFANFIWILTSYGETDVKINFYVTFSSRLTFSELGATLGAHLGIGYRPGMASASAIGRYLGVHLGGG